MSHRTLQLLRKQLFIRNVFAEELLEAFMVSAIATILGIRFFLTATGYPSIGGSKFHISHMLWGGLLMMAAIILVLISLSIFAKQISSIIGGIGFGMFIDELGKYITRDNNYFFEPTVAIIYVIFIFLYLGFKWIHKNNSYSSEENVINALELVKEAVIHDLDTDEKQQALNLLRKADKYDPVAAALQRMIQKIQDVPPPDPSLYTRIKEITRKLYFKLVKKKWFSHAIIAFFILHSGVTFFRIIRLFELFQILFALLIAAYIIPKLKKKISRKEVSAIILIIIGSGIVIIRSLLNFGVPELHFIEWGNVIFSTIPSLIVIYGVYQMKGKRLRAYKSFKLAILIEIFLTQFFAFYLNQFDALLGLFGNILILITLQYMIREEGTYKRKIRQGRNVT